MPFPTANVTQGSGLTINTLPNVGQAAMANRLSMAIASDQTVPVTSPQARRLAFSHGRAIRF
jgi:hypothetical protein